MKLDVPLDVAGTKGLVKSSYVLLDGDAYTIGKLSDHPLEFYAGFRYRMYENPYFVNKVTRNAEIDGVKQVNPTDEAFKTAGTAREAESFLGRIANKVEVSPVCGAGSIRRTESPNTTSRWPRIWTNRTSYWPRSSHSRRKAASSTTRGSGMPCLT